MDAVIGHNSGLRWISLSVDARFHPLIGCGLSVKPADAAKGAWSRFEAWIDLICEASWKRREVFNKGKTILLERGELMAARGWLAQRWNWTEKQVRGFLERLEAEFMVKAATCDQIATKSKPVQQNVLYQGQQKDLKKGQQKRNLVKVLSICNYDIYQTAKEIDELLKGQQKDQHEATSEVQQKGQQRASKGPESYQVYKGDTDPGKGIRAGAASGRRWQDRDPFGLNPWQAKQHEDVKFDPDFRLQVCNGFEQELRALVEPANLDLRETLDEAAKYVGTGSEPSKLKVDVRAQVTRLTREAKERAAVRAQRAAKPSASKPNGYRYQSTGTPSQDACRDILRERAARREREAAAAAKA